MTLETLEKIYTDWLRDGKRLVDSLNGLGLAVGGAFEKRQPTIEVETKI
jgi:hypothetical protein